MTKTWLTSGESCRNTEWRGRKAIVSAEISHAVILACATVALRGAGSVCRLRWNEFRALQAVAAAAGANLFALSRGSASMRQSHQRPRFKSGVIRPMRSQIGGVALAVEPDEAFNPIDVSVLRPGMPQRLRRILSRRGLEGGEFGKGHCNVLESRFRPRF